jgi:hypothetical protein
LQIPQVKLADAEERYKPCPDIISKLKLQIQEMKNAIEEVIRCL